MRKDPKTQVCSNPDCPKEQPRPIKEFAIRADNGKRRGQCKDCVAIRRTKHWHDNKEELSAKQKTHYQANRKRILATNSAYWQRTKEARHQKQREYHQSEQGKKTTAEWKKKNRKRIREKKRALHKKKVKTDPTYKIRCLVSQAVCNALNGRKNGKATWEHLPYSPQKLRDHLESLFEPWMTWDNHGRYNVKTWDDNDPSTWTWNIDHIIPQSTFKFKSMKSKSFQKCWALSNLRPLSAKQNIIDGGRQTRHNKKKQ